MFDKLFDKPIELLVGEQTLKFSTIIDFEFALNGRTSIPSNKITGLVRFSTIQLKKEAHIIKEVEKNFVSILSKSIEDPNSIDRSLREIDPVIFSQDHGWREIIGALNNSDYEEINEFKRMAIVKYMQYLSARQEIIKYLYSEKIKHIPNGHSNGDAEDPEGLKTTVILDSTVIAVPQEESKSGDKLERMPKGEAVTIHLLPGKDVNVLLSKHECKLVGGDDIEFIDHEGNHHKLMDGRNVVGRDTVSTIMLDSSLRDVSRLHLVIEKKDKTRLQLTDLSSHGTFLPAKFIESHGNTV